MKYEWIYFRDRLWLKEGRSTRSTGLDIFWALKVSIFRKDLGLVEGANTVGKSLYSIILV